MGTVSFVGEEDGMDRKKERKRRECCRLLWTKKEGIGWKKNGNKKERNRVVAPRVWAIEREVLLPFYTFPSNLRWVWDWVIWYEHFYKISN